MGFILLGGLSALAVVSAVSVAVRARLQGRAELLVAATLLWNAFVVLPIYVLGLTNRLYPWTVAVGSLLTSSIALVLAARGPGLLPLLRETNLALRGQLRLPFDALALAWRSRSLVFLGVLFAALLLPYLAVSAYLGHEVTRWDPLWYHDPIVGFTIQNHGFKMVDLPPTLQKVNGYVRLGEMTQLWMVIFSDRRLADATNLLFAPAIAAAVYVLARRYASALIALGWAVAVVVMPGCANLLHSTYVDPQNAALLLGGIVFATRDRPRLRDAHLAALGLALAIGSKGLSLVPVPVVGLLGAIFLLRRHWYHRRSAAVATVIAGAALIVGTAATTYLRNYWWFHNPFWPDLRVDIDALGIHWPGQGPWTPDPNRPGDLQVNLNEPLSTLLDQLFALPWSVKGMYFDQIVEYGIGVAWIAIPLGAVAFVACLIAGLRLRLEGPALATRAAPPVAIAIILAVMVVGSPALWGPRYHTAHVGLLVTLIAWLTSLPQWRRIGEEAVSIVLVTSIMMCWWTPVQRYWFTGKEFLALLKSSPLVREVSNELRAPTTLVTGLAREKELGPGSLLVFNERYASFPSLFWNNTFSNRIMYIKGGADFLERAAAAGATWVVINGQDPLLRPARTAGSGWQEVGPMSTGFVFRRVKPSAPIQGSSAGPAAPPPAKPAVSPPAKHPVPQPAGLVPPKAVTTPKAGTPKAGTPKAGIPKAGTPKAGIPKAGTPKAGTHLRKPRSRPAAPGTRLDGTLGFPPVR